MKVAVLSDTRLPTAWGFPGHGLGKVNLMAAEYLAERGHDVTLFAGLHSGWDGETVIAQDEREYLRMEWGGFDAILDSTHQHRLSRKYPALPVVNWSHDREAHPGKNAVYPSYAHQHYHGGGGRVNPNGVPMPEQELMAKGDYVMFVGTMYKEKAPVWAASVAREAGIKLIMAGPTPPMYPAGDCVEYVGPVEGAFKYDLMAQARALLFLATTESGGLTALEAQAAGTPVLVSAWGAGLEQIKENVTGRVVRDTLEGAAELERVMGFKPEDCRDYIANNRTEAHMGAGLEVCLNDAAKGVSW